MWLREIHGREEGLPPSVDLAHEKSAGDFVRGVIRERLVTAVHDVSDGGLAAALAEMAMALGIGAAIDAPLGPSVTAAWFGEDQGRYILTARSARNVMKRAEGAGVSIASIGRTGGTELKLGSARAISVAELRRVHETWFPAFMGS
jgi:phosphoribosylformylglycinamidine synthase